MKSLYSKLWFFQCRGKSWTMKKAECWRSDAFELWCWGKFLRVPLTKRSNQSILKEINPEYSLEGLMKLKLQYFGHLMWRVDSLEKTLMLGRLRAGGKGIQRTRWLDSITDSTDVSLSKLRKTVNYRDPWHPAVHGVTNSQAWLGHWPTTITTITRQGETNRFEEC